MYTWGYLMNVALAKLDITLDEANEMKFVSRFPYYANEAMTQICSSVKPDRRYFDVIFYKSAIVEDTYVVADGFNYIGSTSVDDNVIYCGNLILYPIGQCVTMPSDFVSFNDSPCKRQHIVCNTVVSENCHNDVLEYVGHNKITALEPGKYNISYNARWFDFTDANEYMDLSFVPADVLDCIPSYIASQCYKVDDEVKSSIYRNEYEIFLARIDNSDYTNTGTFKIEGDW